METKANQVIPPPNSDTTFGDAVRKKDEAQPPAPPPFDSSADTQTIQQAFQESTASAIRSYEWADAIDRKVVAVFTLATAIAGIAPIGRPTTALSALAIAGLVAAFVAWTAAVTFLLARLCSARLPGGPRRSGALGGQLARPVTHELPMVQPSLSRHLVQSEQARL